MNSNKFDNISPHQDCCITLFIGFYDLIAIIGIPFKFTSLKSIHLIILVAIKYSSRLDCATAELATNFDKIELESRFKIFCTIVICFALLNNDHELKSTYAKQFSVPRQANQKANLVIICCYGYEEKSL